ncbi:MAG: twin-arginine translocase subunit TatC [Planctomycetaceae bacterium]|nr:twin-arginine translocase subunit TatC [Planctomycetaceae bacterium]
MTTELSDLDGDDDGALGALTAPAAAVGAHLDELRRRVVVCAAVFVPLFGLGMYLYQPLWLLVIAPLDRAKPDLLRFQALGPSDGLIMAMKIAMAFSLFITLPLLLAQLWAFVAPGLNVTERRWLYLGLGGGGVLFLVGAAFAYFVGLPFALEFLLPFNQTLAGWENSFTGAGYVDFVIACCAGFGVAFELPLVMLVLGWVGILTPETVREWWRVIVLVIVVLAAILTPPDPATQILLAVPLLALFVLGYWLLRWAGRRDA